MINIYRIITIVLAIISIIAILTTTVSIPNNLILIPLVFLCLFIVFPSFSKYMFNNLGITIVNLTMLLRYVISPLLISFYGSNIQIGTTVLRSIQNQAINLMLYEMIVLFIVFAVFHKYFYFEKSSFNKINAKPNLFGWIFVLLAIGLAILQPSSIGRYSFIWSASELNNNELADVSLFALLVQLAQVVLTINILNIIFKYYKKRQSIFYLYLSIIVIVISASFIIGTSRSSVILPLIAGLFTIYILYKNYRRIISFLSTCLIVLIIVISTLLKQNTTISTGRSLYHSAGLLENLNTDIQIYLSGVTNIAHSIETAYMYKPFQFYGIFGELLHSVVFVNQLFINYQSAIVSFNNTFYKKIGVNDQILPLLGQGYLYFGSILAPIFSVLALFIVMLLDKKIHKSSSVFNLYIYIYLCVKFSLFFMSNATILISFFTNFFIVLFIIALLNRKFVIKGRT
ncbi:O-antigen polymerase [Staphylococcus hominis]|uniref:O-antigen polymerase n=1 Tax=Staphylococcus hominis TaxID=1290 RepID=UPI00336AB3ED